MGQRLALPASPLPEGSRYGVKHHAAARRPTQMPTGGLRDLSAKRLASHLPCRDRDSFPGPRPMRQKRHVTRWRGRRRHPITLGSHQGQGNMHVAARAHDDTLIDPKCLWQCTRGCVEGAIVQSSRCGEILGRTNTRQIAVKPVDTKTSAPELQVRARRRQKDARVGFKGVCDRLLFPCQKT